MQAFPSTEYDRNAEMARQIRQMRTWWQQQWQLNPASQVQVPDEDPTLIDFVNHTGDTIPIGACMQMTGVELKSGKPYMTVDQYQGYGCQYDALINFKGDVEDTQTGKGIAITGVWPVMVQYEMDDGTPQHGDQWGPRKDSWFLRKDTPGFQIMDAGQNWTMVMPAPFLTVYGKTIAEVNFSDPATLDVYASPIDLTALKYDDGSTVTVQVQNPLTTVPIGQMVAATWTSNGFMISDYPKIYYGKTVNSIAQNANGPVTIWTGGLNAETATTRVANLCGNRGPALAAGAAVRIVPTNSGYEIVNETTSIVPGNLTAAMVNGGATSANLTGIGVVTVRSGDTALNVANGKFIYATMVSGQWVVIWAAC